MQTRFPRHHRIAIGYRDSHEHPTQTKGYSGLFPPFTRLGPIDLFEPLFRRLQLSPVHAHRDGLVQLVPNAPREFVHTRARIKPSDGRQMGFPLGRLNVVVDDVGRVGGGRVEETGRCEDESLGHGIPCA